MKTLVLSTVCGLALLAASTVSTAQAGHPVARARAANRYQAKVGIRQTKVATRQTAAESYRAQIEARKANVSAVQSSRVEAVENLQTNVASLADQIRGNRLSWFLIGDIKGEHPVTLDGVDGESPLEYEGVDGEHPLQYEGIGGEQPLPSLWWLN